jgi:hypothetical protein
MYSGETYDGLKVIPEYCNKLMWTFFSTEKQPYNVGFGFNIEFNKDAMGRKWPYLVVWIYMRSFQCGWLWGDSDLATAEQIAGQRAA